MADTESTEVRESKPDTEPTTEDVVPSVEEEVGGDDTVAIQDGSDVSKDVEGGSETQRCSHQCERELLLRTSIRFTNYFI